MRELAHFDRGDTLGTVLRALGSVLTVALLIAGCGGDDDKPRVSIGPVPESALPPAPTGDARASAGRRLMASTGCLACHALDGDGTDGPGPDLSALGSRVSAEAFRRILVDPPLPMPSFRQLGDRKLDALTAYLTTLDGK